jgi:hypothetical protein
MDTEGSGNYYKLSNREFADNLKFRLGCKLYIDCKTRQCCCRREPFPINSNHFHALSCNQGSKLRSEKHFSMIKILNKHIKTLVESAQIPMGECKFNREELQPTVSSRSNNDIRADVRVYLNGTVRFIDVGITAPTVIANQDNAAKIDLHASKMYALKKINKYSKYLTQDSMKYLVPFIVESTGAFGNHAKEFIRFIKNIKNKSIDKKIYKKIYKNFRDEQIIMFAKVNSKLLRKGYVNQIIIDENNNSIFI